MPKNYDLSEIHLGEVSLVDYPANPGAKVTLFKRGQPVSTEKRTMTDKMTPDQESRKNLFKSHGFADELASILATLEQGSAVAKSFESISKSATDAANAAVEKALKEAGVVVKFDDTGAAVVEKSAPEEYVDFEGERLLKSAVPAGVLSAIEKANKRVDQLEKAAKETALTKRGSTELPNLAGSDLAKGMLLDAIDKMDSSLQTDLVKGLKAADAAMAASMVEKGANGDGDAETATAQLDKMAGEYAAKHDITKNAAYLEVTKAGADGYELYKAARKEASTQ